ncbi:DNA cytosine methyltransferase [Salinispirillum sp. LH 10-3-1]|uniref:DNA (cytosine-5-)-methyltransferase n=1 Tax=Salinispirillum sp. LH 10-3-1 TaxID=2952525 RepID=A0AB38YC68_9GAMM
MNQYRTTPQMGLYVDELLVDNFAGGGGASTGIEAALGRPVDIAINHDLDAVSMHTVNHPHTRHYCESVWEVNPREITYGLPVGLAWFSPDCKHFSKAKGGTPVSKEIRGLAWVAVRWAATVRPRVIMLENVEEFMTWGPIVDGKPCKRRKGQTFNAFINALKRLGYAVETRVLRASDFGAPTIRKRLFLVARCDGQPIVWPEPTHGDPAAKGFKQSGLKPWQTAADIIDWSIPCPSIFGRKKPLAENTLRRIARGIQRFVFDNPKPYIVRIGQQGFGGDGMQYSIDSPLTTITTKAEHCLVVPHITKFRNGSTGTSMDEPLHTITAGGDMGRPGTPTTMGLVTALLAKHYGGGYTGAGSELTDPLHTVTTTDHNALVAASMVKLRGTNIGSELDSPLHTVSAGGTHHALVTSHIVKMKNNQDAQSVTEPLPTLTMRDHVGEVRAFLIKYYGTNVGHSLNEPLQTVTTKDRFGLVVVKGELYQIVDIGMRMLEPHELFAAQGFPADYIIDRNAEGKPRPKYQQVARCGNSVCPPVAAALVQANMVSEQSNKRRAVA